MRRARIGRPPLLSLETLEHIKAALESGISIDDAAKCHGTSASSIKRALRYRKSTASSDKKTTTCPRRLSDRDVRRLTHAYRKGEVTTLKQGVQFLCEHMNIQVSESAVRSCLLRNDFTSKRLTAKTRLSRKDRQKRLKWALKYESWTVDQWRKVVFTDETIFRAYSSSRRTLRRWVHKDDDRLLNLITSAQKSRLSCIRLGIHYQQWIRLFGTHRGKFDLQQFHRHPGGKHEGGTPCPSHGRE